MNEWMNEYDMWSDGGDGSVPSLVGFDIVVVVLPSTGLVWWQSFNISTCSATPSPISPPLTLLTVAEGQWPLSATHWLLVPSTSLSFCPFPHCCTHKEREKREN